MLAGAGPTRASFLFLSPEQNSSWSLARSSGKGRFISRLFAIIELVAGSCLRSSQCHGMYASVECVLRIRSIKKNAQNYKRGRENSLATDNSVSWYVYLSSEHREVWEAWRRAEKCKEKPASQSSRFLHSKFIGERKLTFASTSSGYTPVSFYKIIGLGYLLGGPFSVGNHLIPQIVGP